MSGPRLSVVVVVLAGREALVRCLQAVHALRGVEPLEVIVAHDDRHPDVASVSDRFPGDRFVRLDGERTYAEVRSLGMKQATADVIALTEDHCAPLPGWGEAILAAHAVARAARADGAAAAGGAGACAGARPAIGGPVDKDVPDGAIAWAVYLLDYARYASPLPEGPAHELTDCNVSYRRDALEAIAEEWRDEFHEPRVHAKLVERGGSLWQSPGIAVRQRRPLRAADALRERLLFGRLLGALRAKDAPPVARARMTLMALAVPALLVLRVAGHARRAGLVAPFLRALPWVALLATAWALGELLGYATALPPRALRGRGLERDTPRRQERRRV